MERLLSLSDKILDSIFREANLELLLWAKDRGWTNDATWISFSCALLQVSDRGRRLDIGSISKSIRVRAKWKRKRRG